MDFAGISFEQLQVFAYPLIKALGGPDIAAEVADKAEVLTESAELFEQVAALLHLAATAMEDGVLTDAEVDELITEAEDIPSALYAIQGAWFTEDKDVD